MRIKKAPKMAFQKAKKANQASKCVKKATKALKSIKKAKTAKKALKCIKKAKKAEKALNNSQKAVKQTKKGVKIALPKSSLLPYHPFSLPRLQYAVLVDADNTPWRSLELIHNEISRFGDTPVRHIVGDFEGPQLKGWFGISRALSFSLV